MSKFMGDKQIQTVSEGSTAIQVSGDYHQSGLSYKDVKDICVDLIQANFPVLQEEAKLVSMRYVEDFGVKFFNRLAQEKSEVVQERLKNSDVQAAISSSVIHVARMTNKSHQDILCELLAEKIKETEDEKNIIFNDAIEIMTKISKNQILFLTFIYLIRETYKAEKTATGLRPHQDPMVHYDVFENEIPRILGDNLYKIDTFLLGYKGLIRADSLTNYSVPLTEVLKKRTNIDIPNYKDDQDIKDDDALNINFPKFTKVLRDFGFINIKKFDQCPITSIAIEIAKAHLKNIGLLY